ncbi:hypothetical protein [uncultured Pseudomonas sp.]|uniref:hypothetical protein n=1 Tax=uncultured Pseudomonas sp. TaxID=114707 RepID=UPI0025F2E930|nr:hypothetical protein [uncultured Pseudomonas sp.]
MYRMQKTLGMGLSLALVSSLSACSWSPSGKPYDFPKPGEPSANIRMKQSSDTNLALLNIDDRGCYQGVSSMPYADGYLSADVRPDKPLVLRYDDTYGSQYCVIQVSFTPEKDASYLFQSDTYNKKVSGLIPGLERDQAFCAIGALKKQGDEWVAQPLEKVRPMPTSPMCIRFRKTDATPRPSLFPFAN